MENELSIRTLSDCTFEQTLELWNVCFSEYYSDMTKTLDQLIAYFGELGIRPDLSLAAYLEQQPAGFVMIAAKKVNGQIWAWNGGTAVNPRLRGRGIAKTMMKEAVHRMREYGVDTALLEVVAHNARAIAAYESVDFRTVDRLVGLKHAGTSGNAPFGRASVTGYSARVGHAAEVAKLPYYRSMSGWTGQWFNLSEGNSLLVCGTEGRIVGYALFKRKYDDAGNLSSVVLYQCEADPDRRDADDIVRFALTKVYEPFESRFERFAENLRATNVYAVAALKEAGFETLYEQKLMVLEPK